MLVGKTVTGEGIVFSGGGEQLYMHKFLFKDPVVYNSLPMLCCSGILLQDNGLGRKDQYAIWMSFKMLI